LNIDHEREKVMFIAWASPRNGFQGRGAPPWVSPRNEFQ
jgi:hypothetical protein